MASEDIKARKAAQTRRILRPADDRQASEDKSGLRLTGNPSRASVVRDPASGQTFDCKTEAFASA